MKSLHSGTKILRLDHSSCTRVRENASCFGVPDAGGSARLVLPCGARAGGGRKAVTDQPLLPCLYGCPLGQQLPRGREYGQGATARSPALETGGQTGDMAPLLNSTPKTRTPQYRSEGDRGVEKGQGDGRGGSSTRRGPGVQERQRSTAYSLCRSICACLSAPSRELMYGFQMSCLDAMSSGSCVFFRSTSIARVSRLARSSASSGGIVSMVRRTSGSYSLRRSS